MTAQGLCISTCLRSVTAEVFQKAVMGVPDGLKDIRVRLCAQDFRPVAVQVASGAGAKETAVGTDYGTEERDSAIAGYDLRLVCVHR